MAKDRVEFDLSDDGFVERLLTRMHSEATSRSETAAQSGSQSDGGASALRAQIDAWRCGRAGSIPDSWIPVAQQMANEDDPEWVEFQRLQAKFAPPSS